MDGPHKDTSRNVCVCVCVCPAAASVCTSTDGLDGHDHQPELPPPWRHAQLHGGHQLQSGPPVRRLGDPLLWRCESLCMGGGGTCDEWAVCVGVACGLGRWVSEV